MPEFCGLVMDIGKQLIAFGHEQIKRWDALVEQPGEGTA
jgi:hypothetical protein